MDGLSDRSLGGDEPIPRPSFRVQLSATPGSCIEFQDNRKPRERIGPFHIHRSPLNPTLVGAFAPLHAGDLQLFTGVHGAPTIRQGWWVGSKTIGKGVHSCGNYSTVGGPYK